MRPLLLLLVDYQGQATSRPGLTVLWLLNVLSSWMSSVLSHVSSRSRVSSLRAAHLSNSTVWRKGFLYYSFLQSTTGPTTKVCHGGLQTSRSFRLLSVLGGPDHLRSGYVQNQQLATEQSDTKGDGSPGNDWFKLRLQPPLSQSYNVSGAGPDLPGLRAVDVRESGGELRDEAVLQKDAEDGDIHVNQETEIGEESKALGEGGGREQSASQPDSTDVHSKPLRLTRHTEPLSDGPGRHKHLRPENKMPNSRKRTKRSDSHPGPTPTEYLIDTLQRVHQSHGAESCSWVYNTKNTGIMTSLTQRQRDNFKRYHRLSLQRIVADYIELLDPLSDQANSGMESDSPLESEALQSVFSEDNLNYLAARQYSAADVVAWAWVLKSSTPYEAILRVLLLEADRSSSPDCSIKMVPPFIPLLLLRQSLDAKAFRLLLVYSLHLLGGRALPTPGMAMEAMTDDVELVQQDVLAKPLIEPNMCVTYVIRLLHHARELWPQAQLTIARAFAFYLDSLESEGKGWTVATERINQFMADKFNTVLRILSLPCRHNPFTSASLQQQAQFELLRAMARHQPALPVTRRGYQGIVAVQIAHKKTLAERQSAELKAPSWPPWKEDKIGFDVKRGVEGMKSRAMRVLSQMKEAGYSQSRWEEVSSILAGWDTDKSPTIQTRSLVPRPETVQGPSGDPKHHAIWVARIRATRTVREAWACFLSYRDQGLPPRGAIYAAMAEKLIFRQKRARNNSHQSSQALPGDGKEVFAEPSSVRDWIYVSTEPPTLDDFLREMLSQGIRPRGRFLALLLRNAPTFGSGLDYLRCSDLTKEQLEDLCTVSGQGWGEQAQANKTLNSFPDYLISSFVAFLCNFSTVGHHSTAHCESSVGDMFPILLGRHSTNPSYSTTLFAYSEELKTSEDLRHPKILAHALSLLQAQQSRSPQAWIPVMSALARDRVGSTSHRLGRHARLVLSWYEVLELTAWMAKRQIEPSLEAFQVLCYSFSRVVVAGIKEPDAVEEGLVIVSELARRGRLTGMNHASTRFEDMVQSGLNILKSRFDELVLLDPKTSSLFERSRSSIQHATASQVTVPSLVHVPSPAVLHSFVRALGLAEDTDGLLSLLRWMRQYETTLKEKYDENLNGEKMMRRIIVAVRMFLEGYWGRSPQAFREWEPSMEHTHDVHMHNDSEADSATFSDASLQEAYDIITTSQVWGSWPSDEEVLDYIAHGEQGSREAGDRYRHAVH
ncbi:hypothetical protein CBS147343_5516 [Aspergillus niger]|uniref:Uncharacterized protein n=2 Tax=Aspergillus niger TaxID=5061 RepID=A0A505I7M9_ASPNG|nr:hypothetical protein CBS11350_10063 [Aspergillus niger]KAI2866726.1 hypothetical protein CBS12448_1022 [Aspergillus niger]KAI2885805.1 hypothetical protein CBS13152_7419 [Aspergillus niger]KAI2912643.1 hypothetical protein CBS147371_7312 [Aspergillus niger]KAI2923904.1 hypothetical protein CBS147320_6794 [Aspergillus niger]